MSFSPTLFPTRKLRMGFCGKLRERLVSWVHNNSNFLSYMRLSVCCFCYLWIGFFFYDFYEYWEDSFFFFKLPLQWVVQGAVDVDIGANPSAEGADEDEGVDDQAVKVVDIVDTFRLQVCRGIYSYLWFVFLSCYSFSKMKDNDKYIIYLYRSNPLLTRSRL